MKQAFTGRNSSLGGENLKMFDNQPPVRRITSAHRRSEQALELIKVFTRIKEQSILRAHTRRSLDENPCCD